MSILTCLDTSHVESISADGESAPKIKILRPWRGETVSRQSIVDTASIVKEWGWRCK